MCSIPLPKRHFVIVGSLFYLCLSYKTYSGVKRYETTVG
jgi:hypothetical protein